MGKIRPREKLEDRPKDKRQRTDKEISPFFTGKKEKESGKSEIQENHCGGIGYTYISNSFKPAQCS